MAVSDSGRQMLHAAVAGTVAPGSGQRLVWRLEEPTATGAVPLLIASPGRISLAEIAETAGWGDAETPVVRDYTPILDSLAAGEQRAFTITCSPDRKVERRRRIPLSGEAARLDWLIRQGDRRGFAIDPADATMLTPGRDILRFTKRAGGTPVTLARATFTGTLTVTDPDLLRDALASGVGHGRAYGLGMLVISAHPTGGVG